MQMIIQVIILAGQSKNIFIFNLNGLMTPIHKEIIIDTLSCCLHQKQPVAAISTQIIEAGVDLSFEEGLRACALHPCHIQFAGRSNRHGEEMLPLLSRF